MHIIPAIDLIGGKCVRQAKRTLHTKKEYHDVQSKCQRFQVREFLDLHLVDLDGAKAKKIENASGLEGICSQTSLT